MENLRYQWLTFRSIKKKISIYHYNTYFSENQSWYMEMRSTWVVEPCIISSFSQMAGKAAGLATESFLLQIKLQSYSWQLTASYFFNIKKKNKVRILQTVPSLLKFQDSYFLLQDNVDIFLYTLKDLKVCCFFNSQKD